jgi:hypothetical protein
MSDEKRAKIREALNELLLANYGRAEAILRKLIDFDEKV